MAARLFHMVTEELTYDKFKPNIEDYERRMDYYLNVWEVMYEMQEAFELQERQSKEGDK